eukprot:9490649-Pyramimonas_sp.AAC.1
MLDSERRALELKWIAASAAVSADGQTLSPAWGLCGLQQATTRSAAEREMAKNRKYQEFHAPQVCKPRHGHRRMDH